MKHASTMKFAIAIWLFAICTWATAGNPPFAADTQNFGVRLFLVPDADAFVKMWSKPQTPKLTVFNKTRVNTEFAGALLYWGGGADSNGECDIQLQTQVLEGSQVLASGPEMPVCQGHPPPPPGVLALSETMIDLFASGEPTSLTVQVTVTDRVNNETLSVKAPMEILAE